MIIFSPDCFLVQLSVRSTVLCSGIAAGNVSVWDWVWDRYTASNNANEKVVLLNSLACSSEVWVLARYLDMAMDEASGVRKQDGYRVVTGVSKNIVGRYLAWNWIRDKWAMISSYWDTAISSSVGRSVEIHLLPFIQI